MSLVLYRITGKAGGGNPCHDEHGQFCETDGGDEKPDKYGLDGHQQDLIWDWVSGGVTSENAWNRMRRDSNGEMKEVFEKFPKFKGTVYRGMQLRRMGKDYRVGKVFRIEKNSSTTPTRGTAMAFTDPGMIGHSVLLQMQTKTARKIPRMYQKEQENEAVVLKGSKFRVTGNVVRHTMDGDLHVISMKEI